MGADTGLVLIDDVVLEDLTSVDTGGDTGSPGTELLKNGSFEQGTTSWFNNAANVTEELLGFNGSLANFVNVETAAANAFDVNLSQVVPITQGETYILTFKAKSDVERSIVAGIGLNEDPWTNNSQTVDLTADWKTFTLISASYRFW